MAKIAHMLIALTVLSGCDSKQAQTEEAIIPEGEKEARKAWADCLFELDKIEAIRGRNLDDLNARGSVARNQFMVDCMAATEAVISPELIEEMSRYASSKASSPRDMNLNSGTRKLPGDEPRDPPPVTRPPVIVDR